MGEKIFIGIEAIEIVLAGEFMLFWPFFAGGKRAKILAEKCYQMKRRKGGRVVSKQHRAPSLSK